MSNVDKEAIEDMPSITSEVDNVMVVVPVGLGDCANVIVVVF